MDSAATHSERPTSGTKSRTLPDGSHCPQNTYVRYSSKLYDWVYYAKVTIRGIGSEFNTRILASAEGSRQAVCEWVTQKSQELLDGQYRDANLDATSRAISTGSFSIQQSDESRRWVVSVCKLETDRILRTKGENCPTLQTTERRLSRICEFFGHERDVTTITIADVRRYRTQRLKELYRGRTVTNTTIDREVGTFRRAVRLANDEGYFVTPYALPYNAREWADFKDEDLVNEKQRSHVYTKEQCKAWINAAKGTHLEHYTFLAWKTAMRSQELQSLTWSMVKRTTNKAHYAEIHLPKRLWMRSAADGYPISLSKVVYEYLAELAKDKGPNQPLLRRINALTNWTDLVARRAEPGTPRIHLRDLRASAGQYMYDKVGANNLKKVQVFMRHKDIRTTMTHYLRATDSDYGAIAMVMDEID